MRVKVISKSYSKVVVCLDSVRVQSSNEANETGKPRIDTVGESVQTVLGVLLSVRYLMPLLDTTSDSSRPKRTGVVSGKANESDAYVDLALTVKVRFFQE